MKKILLIMALLVLSIGVTFASDYDYEVVITLELEPGLNMDWDAMKYSVWGSDSTTSGGLIKGRYSYNRDGVRLVQEDGVITIRSNKKENMDFILTGDEGYFGYYIQGKIYGSELEAGKKIYKTIRFSDLDKVYVKTDLDEEVQICLYNINFPRYPSNSYVRFSWQEVDANEKPLYLSKGQYDVVVATELLDVIRLYSQKDLSSSQSLYEVVAPTRPYDTYKVSVPRSFYEFDRFSFQGRLDSGEYLRFWDKRDDHDFTVQVEEFLFREVKGLYIGQQEFDLHDKSYKLGTKEAIQVSDQHFVSRLTTREYSDGKINVDTLLTDFNGNELEPLGTDFRENAMMSVYDLDGTLVGRQVFSTYWDYFEIPLESNKTYKAIVSSNGDDFITIQSKFTLNVIGGLPIFELEDVIIENYEDLSQIESAFIDNRFVVTVDLINLSCNSNTYDLYSVGQGGSKIDAVTLSPMEKFTKDYVFTSSEIMADTDKVLQIKLGQKILNEKTIAGKGADDIGGHWAETIINRLLIQSIIFNRRDQVFEPNGQITRGEFSAFLSLALNLEKKAGAKNFKDVGEDHNLYYYISTASSNGLIGGYPDGDFKPDQNIKRQDLAIIIKRGLQLKGIHLGQEDLSLKFVDGGQVDPYAVDGVNYCLTNKLLSGKPGNKLDPQAFLTRAEAAAVIERVLNYLQ